MGGTSEACGKDSHHYGGAIIFSKEEKCEFGMTKILYLGHMIGVEGVKVHQEKIYMILDFPTPRSLIELRGFFRICSYYRRFVKGFS
jgi:hypothetical protein